MVIGHAAFGLHAATPARAPRPPLYLSVMREPLSRRISLFHYVLMWPGHQDYERAANLTLGQFVSAPGLAAYGFAHLNQQLCMLAGFVAPSSLRRLRTTDVHGGAQQLCMLDRPSKPHLATTLVARAR
jgi:hypothetical protein